MTGERILRVRVRTVGQETVTRALRNITTSSRQAATEQRRQEQQTAREAQRSIRARERAAQVEARDRQRLASQTARAAIAAERETTRAAERARQAETRAAERSAREQSALRRRQAREAVAAQRAEERRAASAARRRARVVGGLAAVGSAVVGAVGNRVSAYQGALGVRSTTDLASSAIDRGIRMQRLGLSAGQTPEQMAAMQQRMAEVSRATLIPIDDLAAGLEVAHNRFSSLTFFSDRLEEVARIAQVSGGSVQDFVGSIGEFHRQLGVQEGDVHDLIGSIYSAAQGGSVEAGDLAQNFSGVLSAFAGLRGAGGRGLGGAQEALGLFESLGANGQTASQTATRAEAITRALQRRDVQSRVESALHDRSIFDRNGTMQISFQDLFQRMAGSSRFQTGTQLQSIFGARGEVTTPLAGVLGRIRAGETPLSIDANAGNATLEQGLSVITDGTWGRALQVAIDQEADFSSQAEHVVTVMTDLVGPITRLQTEFPLLSDAASDVTSAFQSIVGLLAPAAIVTGGFGTAGAAGGAGALGALGGGGAGVGMLEAGGIGAGGLGAGLSTGAVLGLGGAGLVAGVAGAAYMTHAETQQHMAEFAQQSSVDPELALAQSFPELSQSVEDRRSSSAARESTDTQTAAVLERVFSGGLDLSQESADAIGRSVAGSIPTAPTSPPASAPAERRHPRGRR